MFACRVLLLFLLYQITTSEINYEDYDYDWLTKEPPVSVSTKSPDDDDVIVSQLDDRKAVDNAIATSFSNRKSFSCPAVKSSLHTGENVGQLSPEDISIVAAMGDSLASGRGLWSFTEVEFRGAAFPIGGDANIDGLVTIPNILLQFVPKLEGVSHGMGPKSALPDYQFNVAEIGAETEDLPSQAIDLVHRMHHYAGDGLKQKWAMVTIATGSEEFCEKCEPPNRLSIRKALGVLRKGIPRALVVLLGPVHVASTYRQNINLMRPRCKCLEHMSGKDYRSLFDDWKDAFIDVEKEFNSLNPSTFGVLAIPSLAIHSRNPHSLLVPGKALLNRKGHSYAAKWLWNRIIAGPNYNFTSITLSEDTYYCPSVGCPYFRTVTNFRRCVITTEEQWLKSVMVEKKLTNPETKKTIMKNNLGSIVAAILGMSILSVMIFGTYFYCHGMRATKGRFDYGQQAAPVEET